MTATGMGVKFDCWLPDVSGGVVFSTIQQRTSHDIGCDVTLAQIARRSGSNCKVSEQV